MDRRDIIGTEFDWFAVDQDGNFALFATAGKGPVPDQILHSLEPHDEIAKSIAVVGWGSSEVWSSYARVGLFVYDWSDADEAYQRVAEPAKSLSLQLAERLRASSLPKLPISFPLEKAVRRSAEPPPEGD